MLDPDHLIINSKDLRQGVGIGGWHIEWTATHTPTKCSVTWQTKGGPQNRARAHALACLELLVEPFQHS